MDNQIYAAPAPFFISLSAYSIFGRITMKFEEHKIVQQVMRSRQDPEAADQLIDPICHLSKQKPHALSTVLRLRDGMMSCLWPCLLFMKQ